MIRNEPLLKRIFRWRLFFVVNVLFLFLLGFTFGREYLKTREIQKEIDGLQAQADALEVKNLSMNELSTAIQTQSFIEREARLKLGMKKPGENVVIFTDDAGANEDLVVDEANPNDPLGLVRVVEDRKTIPNATKWWYYFFHRTLYDQLSAYEN